MKPFWSGKGVELYLGDCREVVCDLPATKVDALIADPPYGQSLTTWTGANIRGDGARQGMRIVRGFMSELGSTKLDLSEAHHYWFCHWESQADFYDSLCPHFQIKNALVWFKDAGGMGDTAQEYARDFEVILYGVNGKRALQGRRDGAVIRQFRPVNPSVKIHPTQKPHDLIAYLMGKSVPPGGLVLDPFAGSGSTGIAAIKTGRRAILCELDPKFAELAAKALDLEARQIRMDFDLTRKATQAALPIEVDDGRKEKEGEVKEGPADGVRVSRPDASPGKKADKVRRRPQKTR